MPLLKEMIIFVDVSSSEVQEYYQSLITLYITQTIGQEPKKPSDWARPEEVTPKCSKNCDNCLAMKEFLRNSEAKTYNLPCAYDWHLRMKHYGFEYFEVEKVDGKDVAVTKTLKWWEKLHQQWERRASAALEAIQKASTS